ncbi:MAG: EamA/RhaT family transporter, partial [Salegentibacter mishustinae]|nr:EamA/RhaT family transporter [Salegentibacter mishustinae]
MDNQRILAIFAAIGASAIYGLNHTIAKGVMPTYIEPFGFIFL